MAEAVSACGWLGATGIVRHTSCKTAFSSAWATRSEPSSRANGWPRDQSRSWLVVRR